jgi:hypothetical protein
MLVRFLLCEEIDRCGAGCSGRLRFMRLVFGLLQPITLHFGVFAHVMFLARADEGESGAADEQRRPGQGEPHAGANLAVKL